MKTKQFVDKSKWSRGPWDSEPDKAQWVDTATQLDCLIVRGPSGSLCGYVGVPSIHPLYKKDDSDVDVEVHGGLTFYGLCQEDHEHGICHVPEPGRPDNVWWLGFDTAHFGDFSPAYESRMPERTNAHLDIYRTFDYVKDQCTYLAEQLAKAAETEPAR